MVDIRNHKPYGGWVVKPQPMPLNLTYLRKSTSTYVATLWVSPSGWAESTIRADFERRFPDCLVIKMEKTE